jgi:hypothetical protein
VENEPDLDHQCLEITRDGGSIADMGPRALVDRDRSRYVRDVALGEDGRRIREASGAHVMP